MMGHFLEISIKDWVLLVFGAILSLIVTGLIYGYGWLRHRHVQNALQTTDGLRDELKTLQKVYARLQQTYETLNAQRAALLPQLILAHDKAQPDEAWRYQDGLANWLTVWRERLGEHAAHLALALLVNPDGEENQGLAMALLAAALGNRSAADLLIENEVKALAKADDLGAGSSNPAWEHLFQAIRPTQRQDQIALCNNAGRKGQEAYKAGDYRLATRWFRLALYLGEVAYGPDHPHVARYLNNLGQLLQATNRLVEAEPLMRRQLEILLAFKMTTGHEHQYLGAAIGNYTGLLEAMGRSSEQIREQLNQVGVAKKDS